MRQRNLPTRDLKLRDKAIDYLARREHSRFELKRKLQLKQFSDEEIESTLDQLQQENLQNDERFAESYVRYRKQAGFGPLRIIAELRERGVSESIVSSVVDIHSHEWRAQMSAVCEKKFSDAGSNKPKQFRFLLSRGFSTEMINRLLFD